MSLIHDALVKARNEGQTQQSADGDGFVLNPNEAPARRDSYLRSVRWGYGVGIALLLISVVMVFVFVAAVHRPQSALAVSDQETAANTSVMPDTAVATEAVRPSTASIETASVEKVVSEEQSPADQSASHDIVAADSAALVVGPELPGAEEEDNEKTDDDDGSVLEPLPMPVPPDPLAGLRDKTMVKVAEHPALGQTLQLEGIVWSSVNPVAMINGTLVRPDDRLGDVTVVTISRQRVTLQVQDATFRLRMP